MTRQAEEGRESQAEAGVKLHGRLKWLIVLRVAATSLLLVGLALFQYGRSVHLLEYSLPVLQLLAACVYGATVAYAIALWRGWNLRRLGLIQLGGDLGFITALIHVTGGIDSGFSFLYILSIIVAALLFYRRGAFGMAAASTLGYGGLLSAHSARWIDTPRFFINPAAYTAPWEAVTNIVFTCAVFFVVALLSGYFAEQLRLTDRRLRERESDLERLRGLTHQIVSSMGSGLLTVDAEDRITFINQTGETIAGYESSRILGAELSWLFPELEDVRGISNIGQRLEINHRRPEGKVLFLGCSFSTLNDQQGGRILIFQDLTGVKAAQESAERNERLAAVGRLSAGMAHEIRNPLASIQGSVEILDKELALTDYQGRLMKIVLREADRLNLLLTDFLLFARPQEVKLQPVPIAELLTETAEVFHKRTGAEARIETQIDAPAEILVHGDPAQIRQLIWNFMLNARDAMPEGGRLRITVRPLDPPERLKTQENGSENRIDTGGIADRPTVELRFADTGVGIPRDSVGRIFEPFFTTKTAGTGLGLATVYRIVEAHEGTIHVQSEPGKGTVFVIRIPLSTLSNEVVS